ncbi:ABC transporter permease [Egicoccus halophilus]|uniref:ABC transporter n=1 Tax=Egicoccus halophilus TaxID=1670830 RepID=A0A8J3A962_9ACTN|nr:ABC transporter permease [Egicoccus halophilus]GGI07171.1 ABC transporter [Egicoccus halophilus]
MTALTAPTATRDLDDATRRTARLLRVELRDELLSILREPTGLFFAVAMPVGFFALFAGLYGAEDGGGIVVGTRMLATFGTFGVLGVTLLNPGIGVADDRERGWLRAKRVTATPLPVTLVAKVLATVPYSVGVLLAMTGIAAAMGTLDVEAATWLRLASVLVVGALPFALVALAVGFLATPNATTAVLNALYLPASIASGLWMPLENLPDLVGERLAPLLPTYHLAQLGLAQIGVGTIAGHVWPLAAFAVVAAVVAGLAYRSAKP